MLTGYRLFAVEFHNRSVEELMEKTLSIVATFLIGVLISAWLSYQHEIGDFDFSPERSAVPLVVLCFAQPLYLFQLWLFRNFLVHTEPADLFSPRFFAESFNNQKLSFIWEKVSLIPYFILPTLLFLYFWTQFDDQQIWKRPATDFCSSVTSQSISPHSPFSFPDDLEIALKAQYRYGDFYRLVSDCRSTQSVGSASKGVDYFPVLQPLAMMLVTAVNLAFLLLVSRSLLLRFELRSEFVRRLHHE